MVSDSNAKLAPAAPSAVSYYIEDGGATTSVLNDLERDPSWQNVSEKIGTIAGVQNDAKWAIGEILVFWRYRAAYTPIAEFEWVGGEWPDELFEFIKKHTGRPLSVQDAEIVEFVAWNTYRYDKLDLWLLVPLGGKGAIKVWKKGKQRELGEDEFENFVRRLAGSVLEVLDDKTLLSYYYTVACFPRSARIEDISWTAHYEVTNLAGNEIDDTLRGIQRLEAKAPIAQEKLKAMSGNGRVTVSRVRAEQKKNAAEKRGYEWLLPPVVRLYVKEPDGNAYVALDFNVEVATEVAIQAICFYAGLTRAHARVDNMIWSSDPEKSELMLPDGILVATCPNPNEPVIANALAALANRMKWKVER